MWLRTQRALAVGVSVTDIMVIVGSIMLMCSKEDPDITFEMGKRIMEIGIALLVCLITFIVYSLVFSQL